MPFLQHWYGTFPLGHNDQSRGATPTIRYSTVFVFVTSFGIRPKSNGSGVDTINYTGMSLFRNDPSRSLGFSLLSHRQKDVTQVEMSFIVPTIILVLFVTLVLSIYNKQFFHQTNAHVTLALPLSRQTESCIYLSLCLLIINNSVESVVRLMYLRVHDNMR
jgi:hypothetical protein